MMLGQEKLSKAEKKYVEKLWAQICEEGNNLKTKKLPELKREDFWLYQKTGNRLVYEAAYFGRRKFLTVFGILSEYEDCGEYLEKLSEIITAVCEEEFWALPAHVDFENLDKNTIDLFASETAATLAEMAYLFYEKLPQKVREHMLEQIVKRVVEPFSNAAFPYSWWETDSCNWSAVCAGNIGIAVLYLYKIERSFQDAFLHEISEKLPKGWLESCLKRVCDSLHCYLDGMEEDGACTEGLGYFSYGMSYFTAFVELYEETASTYSDLIVDTHFLTLPKCEKIACFQQKCFFEKGISLSFSDGSCHETFKPGLTTFLAHCYESVEVPDYQLAGFLEDDSCYRWLPNERNIRWLLKYTRGEEKCKTASDEEKAYFLPAAQWMIYQNHDEAGKSLGYAIKGGNNDENHNHNDIGSFLCVYEGEMLLTDLGAGEYTKEYFHEGRYRILCNRSLGHSVPMIAQKEQKYGKEYCADSFVWNEKEKKLAVSFAGAYEKGLITSVKREIQQKNHTIMVTDSFLDTNSLPVITENLVTLYKPVIKEGYVLIEGSNASCQISVNSDINADFRILTKEHSLHDGRKVPVYLIQWDLPVSHACEAFCRIKIDFQCSILQKTDKE